MSVYGSIATGTSAKGEGVASSLGSARYQPMGELSMLDQSMNIEGDDGIPAKEAASFSSPRPLSMCSTVNPAKYFAPVHSPRKTQLQSMGVPGPEYFKTEKYRERGVKRWPRKAGEEYVRRPTQFSKSQEYVPLQRHDAGHAQPNIQAELWTRSLRLPNLNLHVHVGHHHQAFSSELQGLFNDRGVGWSGKANVSRPKNDPKAPVEDWIEKPVAVGKFSVDHMAGTRYQFGFSPRPCVPDSMRHIKSELPEPPRTAR